MIRLLIGLILGMALAWGFRGDLRDPRRHGFHRFFAFVSILAVVLLVAPFWFHDPASPRQLASWVLLAGSLALAVEGFRLLVVRGRPHGGIEATTELVTTGLYRWVRHPLYASLLYGTWGAYLKHPAPGTTALALVASVFLVATARTEEAENLERFGAAYARYMGRTGAFLPRPWRRKRAP